MTVIVVTLDILRDLGWFPDLGATNHVTSDLSNLNLSTEYINTSKLHMGNGAGLHISHIGSSSFTSLIQIELLFLKFCCMFHI